MTIELNPEQLSFNSGEISPIMSGRIDLPKYSYGCKTLQNMLVFLQGPTFRRPGTQFIYGPASGNITANWRWYAEAAQLDIQYNRAGTWETRYVFEVFSGTRRLYDDGTDLCLQELVDGTWTTKYQWEGVTGTYRWAEVGTTLELQWYNITTWETKWVLES